MSILVGTILLCAFLVDSFCVLFVEIKPACEIVPVSLRLLFLFIDSPSCFTETPCVEETPCVSGVVASVPKCVLPSTSCVDEARCVSERPCVRESACVSNMVCVSETPCVSERLCVSGTMCANEMVRVSEARCVRGTACVRSLYVREMTVGMREHGTACLSVMEWCVSVVARRCAWFGWRRRRRQRDKGRVAAVAVLGTAPGLHCSELEVRAVLHTRPQRARLRR